MSNAIYPNKVLQEREDWRHLFCRRATGLSFCAVSTTPFEPIAWIIRLFRCKSLFLAGCQVRSQPDHDGSGGGALTPRNVADERMRSPSGPASAVTTRSASVFSTTDTVPKTKNCRNTWPCLPVHKLRYEGEKKEGGFRIQNLSCYALPKRAPAADSWSGELSVESCASHLDGHRESFEFPGNIGILRLAYFTVAKAAADFARTTETPAAAAKTCTIPPTNVPKAESTPSRFPPAKLRART